MKAKSFLLVCLFVMLLVAVGCAPAKAPKAEVPAGGVPAEYRTIRMVGGSLASRTAAIVMVYAAFLNKHFPEIEWSSSSGATAANLIYVNKGMYRLAAALPAGYVDAYGFETIPQSRIRSVVLPCALTQYFFVIPGDKPWKSVKELPKGSTLCAGPPASTNLVACEVWLGLNGLTKKDFNWVALGKDEQTDAWKAGKLDAIMLNVAGMAPFLIDMQMHPRKFRIFGMTPEEVAKAKAEQIFERKGFSGVDMTNVTELVPEIFQYDVMAPQQPSYLICRDDFPEAISYRMARLMDEKRDELIQLYPALKFGSPQWHIKWAKPPMDIHSGVARYYKEKGYLK